jgi:hypothetical protein
VTSATPETAAPSDVDYLRDWIVGLAPSTEIIGRYTLTRAQLLLGDVQVADNVANEIDTLDNRWVEELDTFVTLSDPEQTARFLDDHSAITEHPGARLMQAGVVVSESGALQTAASMAIQHASQKLLQLDPATHSLLRHQLDHSQLERLLVYEQACIEFVVSATSRYGQDPVLARQLLDSPLIGFLGEPAEQAPLRTVLYNHLASHDALAEEDISHYLASLTRAVNGAKFSHMGEVAGHEAVGWMVKLAPRAFKTHVENDRHDDNSPRIARRGTFYTLAHNHLKEIPENELPSGQQNLLEHIEALSKTDIQLALCLAKQEHEQDNGLRSETAEKLLKLLAAAFANPTDEPYPDEDILGISDYESLLFGAVNQVFEGAPLEYIAQLVKLLPTDKRADYLYRNAETIALRLGGSDNPDYLQQARGILASLEPAHSAEIYASGMAHLRLYQASGDKPALEAALRLLSREIGSMAHSTNLLLDLFTAAAAQNDRRLYAIARSTLIDRLTRGSAAVKAFTFREVLQLHLDRRRTGVALDYADAMRDAAPQAATLRLLAVCHVVDLLVDEDRPEAAANLVRTRLLCPEEGEIGLFYGFIAASRVLGISQESFELETGIEAIL